MGASGAGATRSAGISVMSRRDPSATPGWHRPWDLAQIGRELTLSTSARTRPQA